MKVGDIIIVNSDRVPADLFLLTSTNESVYIKTD